MWAAGCDAVDNFRPVNHSLPFNQKEADVLSASKHTHTHTHTHTHSYAYWAWFTFNIFILCQYNYWFPNPSSNYFKGQICVLIYGSVTQCLHRDLMDRGNEFSQLSGMWQGNLNINVLYFKRLFVWDVYFHLCISMPLNIFLQYYSIYCSL